LKTNQVLKIGNQKGFTLIEMIVTVAIIATLTGIAIPVYIGMKPSIRLSGATRQIMGDLMWARMQAISQNNEFKILFLDNHQYRILDDVGGESTVTKDIHDEYYNVTLTSTANPIIFYPRGNASPADTVVTLTNSIGTKKKVKIAITGRVKIE
jgi:type IV fimbrial biogenesis protein FimT